MARIQAVPREKAGAELQPIYDSLAKKFGHMPNFFGMMAHRPTVLKHFLPLYAAVIAEGTIEAKYKELAYLKTALLNGCEY